MLTSLKSKAANKKGNDEKTPKLAKGKQKMEEEAAALEAEAAALEASSQSDSSEPPDTAVTFETHHNHRSGGGDSTVGLVGIAKLRRMPSLPGPMLRLAPRGDGPAPMEVAPARRAIAPAQKRKQTSDEDDPDFAPQLSRKQPWLGKPPPKRR